MPLSQGKWRVLADSMGWLQAFKNYDEAGVLRRVQCLKYLVLASMLMGSQVWSFKHLRSLLAWNVQHTELMC